MYPRYKSRSQMEAAGWTFSDDAPVPCRDCSAPIIWARSPKGKNVPIDASGSTVHFGTCGHRRAASPRQPAASPPWPSNGPGGPGFAPQDAQSSTTTPAAVRLVEALDRNTNALLRLLAELERRDNRNEGRTRA